METRRLIVDDKTVVVFDNEDLTTDFSMFHQYVFNSAAFTLSQGDTQESIEQSGPYWAFKIEIDKFKSSKLGETLVKLIKKHYRDLNWEFTKVHVNALQYGDSGFVHTDGDVLPGHNTTVTALIYLNTIWKSNWCGETIFYDGNQDAQVAVSPRYGRVVLFDGSINHSAKPPAKTCIYRRMTLAVKLSARE